jgi:TM2 domain-containing membrane protein YozV
MRGQVLGVDLKSGDGQIAGDDGLRYAFQPGDWSDRAGPSIGALIDFEAEGQRARRIYRLPGSQPPPALLQPQRLNDRNKYVAALLAFFLGLLGVHRFYLGRTGSGLVMLLLSITVVGMAVTGIWAFVDMLRYLFMSDDEFALRYRGAIVR